MGAWWRRPTAAIGPVVDAPVTGDADATVHGYLRRLAAALPASARVRREVVAEVGDGLACAVEARVAAGATPAVAAHAAVEELGDAERLAAGLAGELASRAGHRVGLTLVVSGPAVGLAWLAGTASGTASTADLSGRLAGVLAGAPLYPLLLAIAVPAALLAAAGAGAAARHLPSLARWSGRAALVAAGASLAADVMLLAAAAGAPAGRHHLWLGIAATASVLRLTVAAAAAHRIARLELAAGWSPADRLPA
jgi:hypothetical protein